MISLSENGLGQWPILQDHQCPRALHYSFLSWSCAKVTKRPDPFLFLLLLSNSPQIIKQRSLYRAFLGPEMPEAAGSHACGGLLNRGVQTLPCGSYDLCGPPSGNTMQQKGVCGGGGGFKGPLSALTQPSSSNPALSSTRNGHSAVFPVQPFGSPAPLRPPSRSSTVFLDQLIKSLSSGSHLPSTFHKGSRKN